MTRPLLCRGCHRPRLPGRPVCGLHLALIRRARQDTAATV